MSDIFLGIGIVLMAAGLIVGIVVPGSSVGVLLPVGATLFFVVGYFW